MDKANGAAADAGKKGVVQIDNFVVGVLIFIMNIGSPGFGTWVAGCVAGEGCDSTCKSNFCIGLLQMILAPCLCGYIWSIMTGYNIMKAAKASGK